MDNKLIRSEDLLRALRDDPDINGANFAKVKRHIENAQAEDASKRRMSMDELKTARPDYEEMYHAAQEQIAMATDKILWLNEELKRKDKDIVFLEGFKSAVELIFGKGIS